MFELGAFALDLLFEFIFAAVCALFGVVCSAIAQSIGLELPAKAARRKRG